MIKSVTRIIAPLVAGVLLLAGCGSNAPAKQPGLADLRGLLAQDYEAEYIFLAAGLPINAAQPSKDEEGNLYFPVDSDQYKKLSDLERLLKGVYDDEVAARVLATVDENGKPLYIEQEDKLYRSSAPKIQPVTGELDSDTLKITQLDLNDKKQTVASFTVAEVKLDGTEGKLQLSAVETKNGWRLAESCAVAPREVTKPGAGPVAGADGLEQTAQAFLDALVAGDVSQLETLAIDEGSYEQTYLYSSFSYASLAQAGVTQAAITATKEEGEGYCAYTVSLTSQGNGELPNGSYDLAVRLGESGPVVAMFRPVGETPYMEQSWEERSQVRAMYQVHQLMNQQGGVTFASPKELGAEVITEYALWQIEDSYAGGDNASTPVITKEQVQTAILKLFGQKDYQPSDHFYNSEVGGYAAYGRGGVPLNAQMELLEDANGFAKVEVRHYNDPLQLHCTDRVLYTLKNNWNGTYEFVSALRLDA